MRLLKATRHGWRVASLARSSPRVALMIARVRQERLTYLDVDALADLARVTLEVEAAGRPGGLLEAGCALGGSALVIAAAKRPSRPMAVFDVFSTIPPPSAADGADVRERYAEITRGEASGIGGDVYYGYRPNLLEEVVRTFARHGLSVESNAVRLVPGLFQDTLEQETGPVAMAHVDGDWYESVSVCLRAIAPRLVPGGRIVIDDYDHWSGCRRAVDEFLGTPAGGELVVERHARVHLVRPGR